MTDYAVTVTGIAVAAAQDIFELTANANTRVKFKGLTLGQYSDAGDAQDELIGVQIIVGHTTPGSGGAAVTPVNLNRSSDLTASSTVARNNTTIAAAGTPVNFLSDSWAVIRTYRVVPGEDFMPERLSIEPGQIMVVRLTAPADSLTTNATLFFEEIGKMPVS